jgi:predicted Zn-dependent protease
LIIRYDYANLLLDLHKLPEAIEQYQFILKYQQNNSSIWHNLAVAYYEAHLMDQAMAANQRAVALDAAQSAPSTQTSRPRQP